MELSMKRVSINFRKTYLECKEQVEILEFLKVYLYINKNRFISDIRLSIEDQVREQLC